MARILLVLMTVLLGACADAATPVTVAPAISVPTTAATSPSDPATTIATTTMPSTPTSRAQPVIPDQLAPFDLDAILLDGAELLVAVADTSRLRQQGLMGVTDLGDLDGMVFVFDRDSSGGFWMKDTLIPLDIAFFDATGGFVDGFTMEPCTTNDCPSYRPSGPYRYALEMAAGRMPTGVGELRFDQ